ncbi:MAG: hypothetical protein IJR31_06190 [Lachnospiraceae bacterium]|nr:hypothetical protein [Lachnospiraceae bacterium]
MVTYDSIAKTEEEYSFSFKGKSTDIKPTGHYDGMKIKNGSSYMEIDTKTLYYYDASTDTWI